MTRVCRDGYCNCKAPYCQFIGPNADLQRAKNELIAYNDRLSRLGLWQRINNAFELGRELSEILAKIRRTQTMVVKERLRRDTR